MVQIELVPEATKKAQSNAKQTAWLTPKESRIAEMTRMKMPEMVTQHTIKIMLAFTAESIQFINAGAKCSAYITSCWGGEIRRLQTLVKLRLTVASKVSLIAVTPIEVDIIITHTISRTSHYKTRNEQF